MPDREQTTPKSRQLEYDRALAVARKIEVMANASIDELVRKMKLMGFSAEHRAIVLKQVARRALAEAANGR